MKVVGIQAESLGGSFHEIAYLRYYEGSLKEHEIVPLADHQGLVNALQAGQIDEMFIAVDNTRSGRVQSAIEAIRNMSDRYRIVGSITIPVVQQLMTHPDVDIEKLVYVLSQRPALDQCGDNILGAGLSAVAMGDTLGSIQLLMKNGGKHNGSASAAIASPLASITTGAKVVNPQFNDDPNNATKFWVVDRINEAPEIGTHSAITFEVPDHPGALKKAIGILSVRHQLNLTDIDSHLSPIGSKNRSFFAELEHGSIGVKPAIKYMEQMGYAPNVLGSYIPKNDLEVIQPNHRVPAALRHDRWKGREGIDRAEGSKMLYVVTQHRRRSLYRVLDCMTDLNLIDLGRPVIPTDHNFNRGFYLVTSPEATDKQINKAMAKLKENNISAELLAA